MALQQWASLKLTVPGEKTRWLTNKEKAWTQRAVKKNMLTVFLDIKKALTTDLLEKVAIVNSTSYSELIKRYSLLS